MRLVIVEWDDILTLTGWSNKNKDVNTIPTFSVGTLVAEDDKKIVLSSMMSSGSFNCQQAIPRGCIKRIRSLRVATPHD